MEHEAKIWSIHAPPPPLLPLFSLPFLSFCSPFVAFHFVLLYDQFFNSTPSTTATNTRLPPPPPQIHAHLPVLWLCLLTCPFSAHIRTVLLILFSSLSRTKTRVRVLLVYYISTPGVKRPSRAKAAKRRLTWTHSPVQPFDHHQRPPQQSEQSESQSKSEQVETRAR